MYVVFITMTQVVVTALYDIGRSEWKEYNQSYNTYLYWMKNVLKFKSQMVIFTESKFENKIKEMRSIADPNGEMTTYIINKLEDLEIYKVWFDKIVEVMKSDTFLKKIQFNVPEAIHPLYNVIVFNKIFFLNEARKLHPNATHFIWTDAGGIREENIASQNTWPNPAKLPVNTIMHFSHNLKFEILNVEWHTMSQVRHIQGTVVVCPSHLIEWYANEMHKTIHDCLNKNFIGSDEKMFDLIYVKHPEKITLVKLGWRECYDWLKT